MRALSTIRNAGLTMRSIRAVSRLAQKRVLGPCSALSFRDSRSARRSTSWRVSIASLVAADGLKRRHRRRQSGE